MNGTNNGTKLLKDRALLGERLRALRKEAGLTQAELAERLPSGRGGSDRSEKTIGRMERGEAPISAEYANVLGAALGCRPEHLLCVNEPRTEYDVFCAGLDAAENQANLLDNLIKMIVTNRGYIFRFLSEQAAPNGVVLGGDCFALVDNGVVYGAVSPEKYFGLRREIMHYATYITMNLIDSAISSIGAPFELQTPDDYSGTFIRKEAADNG